MTITEERPASRSFQHEAFVYDADDAYVEAIAPVLEGAAEAGATALAVVPQRNADLLRSAVSGMGTRIELIAAEQWYEHPVATIARYDATLRALRAGTRAVVVGEVQFGASDADRISWTRYEAALNRALEPHDARVICPYDARALPATVIEDAWRTHPHVLGAGGTRPSPDYLDPESLFPLLPSTATVPVTDPDLDMTVHGDLGVVRRTFATAVAPMGLDDVRVEELTLALNEVLTNALVHGGGAPRLRVWSRGAEALTCVVEDSGTGVEDPLLGYVAPARGSTSGYGAWLARRLFERSEFMTSAGGLTVVLTTRA